MGWRRTSNSLRRRFHPGPGRFTGRAAAWSVTGNNVSQRGHVPRNKVGVGAPPATVTCGAVAVIVIGLRRHTGQQGHARLFAAALRTLRKSRQYAAMGMRYCVNGAVAAATARWSLGRHTLRLNWGRTGRMGWHTLATACSISYNVTVTRPVRHGK